MIQIISSRQKLRKFIVYDLEWIPGTLEVRMVGVYDHERGYRCYESVLAFLQYEMTSRNRGKWFYAHAGGLADVQFVLDEVVKENQKNPGRYRVDANFSGSSAIICKVVRGHASWTFVDSYWLLRAKLKDIGKVIGLHKGDTGDEKDDPDEVGIPDEEFERRMKLRREWYATVDFQLLKEYNERDCEILWKAIDNFENALLQMGGQLQMTLASCAMQLFRRSYLTKDIPTYGEVNEISRSSYFASRVEVFESRIKNAWYYDINSSFPYSMTKPCPGEFLGRNRYLPDNEDAIYTADCEIETPDSFITTMPIRIKGRVFFPVGKWRGWITSVDISLLKRSGGRVLKVYEVLHFAPFHDLSQYSKDLYAKRKACTNDFEKMVYKLLLNSLYGKFAESSIKTRLVLNPEVTPISREEQVAMQMTPLFPGAWLQDINVDIPHVSVPISSHITSLSRMFLYDFISYCRDCHYCDTDGFSTTEVLSTGKEIGELKLEKRIDEGHFVVPKMYKIDGQTLGDDGVWTNSSYIKGKGFSRITATRFAKLLEGESIEFERMARIRERWRSGLTNPVEETYIKRIKIRSIFDDDFNPKKHAIPKRFTYPDGSTRPWHIDELKDIIE